MSDHGDDFEDAAWTRLRCLIWRALERLSPDRYTTGLDVTGDRATAYLIRWDADGTTTVLDDIRA